MKRKCLGLAIAAVSSFSSATLWAADFDGTKPLLCATVDAHDCAPGETCLRGLPAELGVPQFLRIDFAQKVIVGPQHSTPIRFMDNGKVQIFLQGTELGFAWTIVLDKEDGSMTVTFVNRDDALMLFGACTAM
jgi:hypothetical protein